MNKNIWVLVLIVVLIVGAMVGLGVWLKSASPDQIQPDSNLVGEKVFIRPHTYMTGQKAAKVTLVEFADFQCPACAAQYTPAKQIVEKYKSNPEFNFVVRNFPLPPHANARIGAQAAEAAGAQGKYWEMVELLYLNQKQWEGSISPINIFVGYAEQLGLDIPRFRDEVSVGKYINHITQDLKDAEALGVNATPTFFLNGEKINLAQTDQKIQSLLGQ